MKIVSISEEKKKYNVPQDVQGLVSELQDARESAQVVDLSENSFGPECLLEVVKAISAMKEVKILNFKGIFTGRQKEEVEEGLRHVCKHLSGMESVSYLDMSDNALSLHGMEILAPLVSSLPGLEHLVFNNNGIGIDGGIFLAQALEALSQKSNKLESVEIGRNRLESSVSKIAKSLMLFPHLDTVRVFQNGISCSSVCEFLRELRSLKIRVLDLSDNFLLTHGSEVLGECLNGWDIENLNVSECLVGDLGMGEINRVLLHKSEIQGVFSTVKEVDFSYNEISDSSIEEINDFIEKIGSAKLVFTGNDLSPPSVKTLADNAWDKGGLFVFMEEDEELIFSEDEESGDTAKEELEEASLARELESLSLNANAAQESGPGAEASEEGNGDSDQESRAESLGDSDSDKNDQIQHASAQLEAADAADLR